MKYFKNVQSFEDLKNQFKTLARANHPDAGGDAETMKEINCEYDALFPIWKNKVEVATGQKVNETAESTRRHFYTAWGWAGSRYDCNLSLKEIAKIVRMYVKEKYSTCKFSVRTEYASMCQELHVEIKEFPAQMYKTADDLRKEGLSEQVTYTDDDGKTYSYSQYKPEVEKMIRVLRANQMFTKDSYTHEELLQAYDVAIAENKFYAIQTEYFKAVIDDVNGFVQSYNYDDCDAQIDYFDVNFYYFGCKYKNCVQVEKTARIKDKSRKPATKKAASASAAESGKTASEKAVSDGAVSSDPAASAESEKKTGYTYKITRGEDSRDGSTLWIVRILETLDREAYIAENKAMKERGGYYSKFKHGFLFRFDPSEVLAA